MSNINKKSPSFQEVTGVQDISHESAAACSGGIITLYDGANFTGTTFFRQTGSYSTLGSFDNRASSYNVQAGSWRVFSGVNFTNAEVGGSLLLTGAGNLSSLWNNRISSIQRVS
jgi:Peptidase inhibitor family I36